MFETKHHKPITQLQFNLRMVKIALILGSLALLSLACGILGFMYFESYSATDAFLNAAMLLGGMGQINPIVTEGGKIFAGVYSLYCGLFVLASTGVMLAPLVHRMLHKFHADK